jgi:hypothetical protein
VIKYEHESKFNGFNKRRKKLGKDKIYKRFDLQQTPTNVTREILSSPDILKSYIKWFESLKFDSPSDHIKDLLEWIEEHKEWDLEWFEM